MGSNSRHKSTVVLIDNDGRRDVVDDTRSWIDVPYRHMGRSRQGVDCAGLLYVVFNDRLGFDLGPDDVSYPAQPTTGLSYRQIRRFADRIVDDEAGPGDVVLLHYNAFSTHFGIIVGRSIVQASRVHGRVIEQAIPDRSTGRGRIVAHYRMKGVEPWRRWR